MLVPLRRGRGLSIDTVAMETQCDRHRTIPGEYFICIVGCFLLRVLTERTEFMIRRRTFGCDSLKKKHFCAWSHSSICHNTINSLLQSEAKSRHDNVQYLNFRKPLSKTYTQLKCVLIDRFEDHLHSNWRRGCVSKLLPKCGEWMEKRDGAKNWILLHTKPGTSMSRRIREWSGFCIEIQGLPSTNRGRHQFVFLFKWTKKTIWLRQRC